MMIASEDRSDVEKTLTLGLWIFIALGFLLRVCRFGANYPLWSDEAFVAANFLRRGYLDLLQPLDYGQICPIFFLWAVRASVSVFGFSEWPLRLFPLLCGLASLGLFVRAARTLLNGRALLYAVAIFAVSVGPLRYASEVKPYASDLLAALLLIIPALEWLNDRDGTRHLWSLAALTPLALALSHPAIFVAGGISTGLSLSVWKTQKRGVVVPFLTFNLAILILFPALYFLVMLPQNSVLPGWREGYWETGFPPIRQPLALLRWVIEAHTGKMVGYPGGGPRGASSLTLILMVFGSLAFWSEGRKPALALLLGAFALTLAAAVLRKYPYGNEARHMQYVAPAVCLLAAAGLDRLIRTLTPLRHQRRAAGFVLASLFLGGIVFMGKSLSTPYINAYDVKARNFARAFWPQQVRDAEAACFLYDFKICEREYFNLYTAIYLCNQMIYSPSRRGSANAGPRWQAISESHPLRCVLYKGTPVDHPQVLSWMSAMGRRYQVRRVETITLYMSEPKAPPIVEPIVVFELVPKPGASREIARTAPEGAVRR